MAGDSEPMIEAPRVSEPRSSLGFASRFAVSGIWANETAAQIGLAIAGWAVMCGL